MARRLGINSHYTYERLCLWRALKHSLRPICSHLLLAEFKSVFLFMSVVIVLNVSSVFCFFISLFCIIVNHVFFFLWITYAFCPVKHFELHFLFERWYTNKQSLWLSSQNANQTAFSFLFINLAEKKTAVAGGGFYSQAFNMAGGWENVRAPYGRAPLEWFYGFESVSGDFY